MKREMYFKALAALKKAVDDEFGRGKTQALLTLNGEGVVNRLDNTACSAGLNYLRDDARKDLQCIISLNQLNNGCREELTQEERQLFCDWFLKRSPYAKCIVTKSVKTALTLGIIVDPNYPANLVVGTTIAQRVLWEYTNIVQRFCRFTKAGMDEDAAFVMAHRYSVDDGKVAESCESGHCALNGNYVSKEYISNFSKRTYRNKRRNFNVVLKYGMIHKLWGEYWARDSGIDQKIKELVKVEVAPKEIPNPFALTMNLKRNALTVEACVEYIQSILGE